MNTKKEYSAGGCVYKRQATSLKQHDLVWLIGKHSGYNKWVLPKGMIETGETPEIAAVREVKEETGVIAQIINAEPIHIEHYSYQAKLKSPQTSVDDNSEPVRRVAVYQENDDFDAADTENVLVEKTVNFYVMEYVSGDPSQHDWEMEAAGWYTFKQAQKLLAFPGERQALLAAHQSLLQPKA